LGAGARRPVLPGGPRARDGDQSRRSSRDAALAPARRGGGARERGGARAAGSRGRPPRRPGTSATARRALRGAPLPRGRRAVSGLVDRATRHLLRTRVASAFLLCALASWFASMSGAYRSPNPLAALAVLAGGILLALTGARLVQRVAIAAPSQVSGHMLELAARYAP